MSADRLEDVARLAAAASRQLAAGGEVPDAVAALHHARSFVELADEDGLVDSVESLAEQEDGDAAVADVVDAFRALGLGAAADQLSAAYNWSEDGYPVDADAGIKATDVRAALDTRFEETVDAERLEELLAERLDEDPEAYGL
ncbi:hypothetical protein [Galactobacter valiniphilus]|uniref:hypothetical protein n=1 Tax=Galactobacter valiniphilus TaxID=2676122 RepID=UPI00373697ED